MDKKEKERLAFEYKVLMGIKNILERNVYNKDSEIEVYPKNENEIAIIFKHEILNSDYELISDFRKFECNNDLELTLKILKELHDLVDYFRYETFSNSNLGNDSIYFEELRLNIKGVYKRLQKTIKTLDKDEYNRYNF